MTFITNSLIPMHKPKINYLQNNIVASDTILTGFDIGIPLNIFSNIFTNLHYGYDITNIQNVLVQSLIGYYTYTKDRYDDALEYEINVFNTTKSELYKFMLKNKEFYKISIILSYVAFFTIILSTNNGDDFNILSPYLFLLLLNGEYKSYKQYLYTFKPIYIAAMWTLATLCLPCIMHDHNYEIFNYPIDYLPCFFTLFATSNYADIKDIKEDIMNNITTIPIAIGEKNSNIISIFALFLSIIIFGLNDNFKEREVINYIFEIQNVATIGMIYNNTFML